MSSFANVPNLNEFITFRNFRQPLALSVLGTLKSLEGDARAETLLIEAASISQKDFDDAYTVPYLFLVNHYIRVGGGTGNPLAKSPEEIRMQRVALVPRLMIARAASRFQLCLVRDGCLVQGNDQISSILYYYPI